MVIMMMMIYKIWLLFDERGAVQGNAVEHVSGYLGRVNVTAYSTVSQVFEQGKGECKARCVD